MKRSGFVLFVRPRAGALFVLLCIMIFSGIYQFATSSNFQIFSPSSTAFAAEVQSDSIDGTWQLSLPMPGGTKDSILTLSSHGNELSGTMSNPGVLTDVHDIYGGVHQGSSFRFSADIGRITYFIEGTCREDTLYFDMKTTEVIPLDDGSRLDGHTGEIPGRYLVPVYSPGGIMENHFELEAANGKITGQMYVPVTGNETMPNSMQGAPPNMAAPPGGMPGGAPPAGGMRAASGDKRDVNTFYDGTYEGNHINLFTQTAQGSRFHFEGTIEGDAIKLTLEVTDQNKGLEAHRKS